MKNFYECRIKINDDGENKSLVCLVASDSLTEVESVLTGLFGDIVIKSAIGKSYEEVILSDLDSESSFFEVKWSLPDYTGKKPKEIIYSSLIEAQSTEKANAIVSDLIKGFADAYIKSVKQTKISHLLNYEV